MITPELVARARAVLTSNDRGGYTVPTDRLYPFQWNWDSAFVAMGFATYDLDRALSELEHLVVGQWADGMVPHIVFHQPADTYFPGPDVWRTTHSTPTSGISQPPVFALALKVIADRARPEHDERIALLYRAALAYHRWWAKARDPANTGLVAVLHNWETGRDNSPEWDHPFRLVPETTTTTVRRRDTGHIEASMRPRDEDYRRYIHLVDLYASLQWNPEAMWAHTPFKIADVGINAVLTAAEGSLAELAIRFGTAAERDEIAAREARMSAALATLWDEKSGHFFSRDLISGQAIPVRTSAGFVPLLAASIAPERAVRLAKSLDTLDAGGILPIPSTLPGEPGFEPHRYWRGPVWAVVNWAIARGFDLRGFPDHAALIRREMGSVFARSGFCEYFCPLTREGLGGDNFSWTAAIALLIAETDGV